MCLVNVVSDWDHFLLLFGALCFEMEMSRLRLSSLFTKSEDKRQHATILKYHSSPLKYSGQPDDFRI